MLILGIGLIAIAAAWSGRRNAAPSGAGSPDAPQRRQLLANVRWLHDDVSVRVLSSQPLVASQQWEAVRFKVEGMASNANSLSSKAGGGTWHRLSQAITDTIAALDYVVSVRNDPTASPTTVAQATSLVGENRDILMRCAHVAAGTIH